MENHIETNHIKLSDLVDIRFLQEFQDSFAKSVNVASLMVDNDGPITKPSNFTNFCIDCTRGSKLGQKRCNDCDIKWGKVAAKEKKPVIYSCHSGLTDFAVPIIIDGKHIASILGGQVLTYQPDETQFRKIAKELKIDEEVYIAALRKIKIIPEEQVKAAADLLYVVANAISEMATKNLELIKKNEAIKKTVEQEILLRKINETIRDTLDIEETFKLICKELAQLFNVQRVLITQFVQNNSHLNYVIRKEYKTIPDIKSLDVFNKDKEAALYWDNILYNSDGVVSFQDVLNSDTPKYFRESYAKLGVKSILCASISKGDEKWGSIVLLDYDQKRDWNVSEINFLNTVASQIYISIRQAELYIKNKKQAERELLIRKVTENIRSSLDINNTLNYVCDELARTFNVQRATIIQYPNPSDYSRFVVRREYKLSEDIQGVVNNPSFNVKVGEILAIAIENSSKCLAIDNIQKSDLPKFFKDNYKRIGQKSILSASIEKDEEKWGVIILSEYNYCRHWTEDDINLLKTISNQVYISIKQSELYNAVKKTADNERVLKEIISSSVKALSIKDVINSVITETRQLFNADRCIFVEYDLKDNVNNFIKDYSESLSSDDILSGTSSFPSKKIIERIIKKLKKRAVISVNDVKNARLMSETKKMLVDEFGVKSYLMAPIYYGDTDYGLIILHYVKEYKSFSPEELDLIKSIANQAAAVIYQSKLYSTIEKNEKYIRTVFDNIQDGIITIDDDFNIESCNQAVKEIWGYETSECVGESLHKLLDYKCKNLKDGACLLQQTVYGVKKNGESFPVEINLSKVVTDDKQLTLLVVRDITERKRIEQMKNEFVSTVSHELRTPLTSIRGSLGLVMSGKLGELSDKIKSLLDIANNNCLRLINLINDILDIEKIEAGKMDFNFNVVNIVPLIDNAIQLNVQYAQKYNVGIEFENNIEHALVNIDNDRLIQVITNLLSNAIKFSLSGSSVKVVLDRVSNYIRFSLTNYGSEIPLEFQERIFQKFAQADSSDSRQKGGTGLGLSISRAIIEKLDGKLNFVSENNETTFYFDLPEVETSTIISEGSTVI